jgi:TrmH family RNA methyltransferase
MPVIDITSAANPRVKLAKSLLQRRHRRKHQQFLLEGERLIADSLSAGYPPALFFFTPEAEARYPHLLAQVEAAGAPLLRVPESIFAQLTDTVSPQGVLAVCDMPRVPAGEQGLSLVLDGVRDPGNLGTLLRTAAAADVDQVIVLPGVTDPWSPKAVRAGMGAHFRIAIQQVRGPEAALEVLGQAARYIADARAPLPYTQVDWRQPSAIILGGETEPARVASRWSDVQPIAIPMARGVESLNVAVAGGVILFEAQRQRRED